MLCSSLCTPEAVLLVCCEWLRREPGDGELPVMASTSGVYPWTSTVGAALKRWCCKPDAEEVVLRMEEAIPAKRASADAIATTTCPRLPLVTHTSVEP